MPFAKVNDEFLSASMIKRQSFWRKVWNIIKFLYWSSFIGRRHDPAFAALLDHVQHTVRVRVANHVEESVPV